MRIACGVALALAALALAAGPADAREPRALILFVPADADDGLLERFERLGTVGVTSPTVGGHSPVQMYLDIGQGARISTRTYRDPPPELILRPDGRLAGWAAAVERAEEGPGAVRPGLLGQAIVDAGGRTAYLGVAGLTHDEAAAVADRSGSVATVALGDRSRLAPRLRELLAGHALVAARLPATGGVATAEALAAELGPEVLLVAVRAPRPGPLMLLPTLMRRGGGGGGVLTSRTTRRDGMVAAPDYAPAILAWLGIDAPGRMQGHALETASGRAADVRSLIDRLSVVSDRRSSVLRAAPAAWIGLLALLALAGRARLGLRLPLLAALWLPGVALVTGALGPGRVVEVALLVLGSLTLALATDRLAPWPRAPAGAAAVVVTVHLLDLVLGSPLIVRSLAGPNPSFGARFFGVGNELAAILVMSVLLGTGAALAGRHPRLLPAGFVAACAVAALFVGAGRLGADVGGVIMLGAGGAAAVLAARPGGITRRAAAIAILVPVLALGALIALDAATGGDAHLTRSVLDAESPGELRDVAERRVAISWDSLTAGTTPLTVAVFALLLAWGVVRRRRVLAPLRGDRAFAAAMWGGLAATVIGAAANDSSPTIFIVGSAALVLAAGYLAGKPGEPGLT